MIFKIPIIKKGGAKYVSLIFAAKVIALKALVVAVYWRRAYSLRHFREVYKGFSPFNIIITRKRNEFLAQNTRRT